MLGERGVAKLLDQTLREEKATDKKLTTIAEGSVNKRAAKEWHEQTGMIECGSSMRQRGAQLVGSTVGAAMKRVMPAQATDRGRTRRRAPPLSDPRHAMPAVAAARDRAIAELARRTDGISVAMVTSIAPEDARRCRPTLLERLLPDASLVSRLV